MMRSTFPQSFSMTEAHNTHALLLFAHGSSDPVWAEPFQKLQSIVRRREPEKIVELAFLERMQPAFDEAVDALHARGVRQITVAPIFLAMGGHMRKDLPKLLSDAEARTGITFSTLPALGEVDTLLEAIGDWALSKTT
jgi:sirohydrochlorin cobaltochelatase